jgi:hypothetical protein
LTSAEHADPQLMSMPAVVEMTLPVPDGPEMPAVSRKRCSVKVAWTIEPPAATVTKHELLPLHGAPQVTVVLVAGIAVNMMVVPGATDAEHAVPQFREPPPAQVAVTVPVPLPALAMTNDASSCTNVAVTWVALLTFATVHIVAFTVEQPDHCIRCQPELAFAWRIRVAPTSSGVVHEASTQLTPEPVMVPCPVL